MRIAIPFCATGFAQDAINSVVDAFAHLRWSTRICIIRGSKKQHSIKGAYWDTVKSVIVKGQFEADYNGAGGPAKMNKLKILGRENRGYQLTQRVMR